MSRCMQIDIRLIATYERPFAVQFPHLAGILRQLSHGEAVEKEISLYEIAEILDSIATDPHTPSDLRNEVAPYAKRLMALKEAARDRLLARRLDELDRLLYRMEDVFDDLEHSLGS